MTHGESPYGWGVASLPMAHDLDATGSSFAPPARFIDDMPWRLMFLCILLTCFSLSLFILLMRIHPEPLLQAKTEPVKIEVVLQKTLPQPVQSAKKQTPTPVPKQEIPQVVKQVVPKPEPVPEPRPKPKQASVKLAEEPLPQPKQVARLSAPPKQIHTTIPNRKTEVATHTEATLTVVPKQLSYKKTSQQAARVLPSQRTSFAKKKTPVSEVAVTQPTLRRVVERGTASSLPSPTAVAFAGSTSVEIAAVSTDLSTERYASARSQQSQPVVARRGAITTSRETGTEIAVAPQVSSAQRVNSDRPATQSAPLAGRTSVAFTGNSDEEALAGPNAKDINTTSSSVSTLPEGSEAYGFLDFLTASELDPTVMISLNKLRTCRDPGAEMKLKTNLAALLSQPNMCRLGGVAFDIRNPESAYSIHVDLYNYEQREFSDRCDALALAVQACKARR